MYYKSWIWVVWVIHVHDVCRVTFRDCMMSHKRVTQAGGVFRCPSGLSCSYWNPTVNPCSIASKNQVRLMLMVFNRSPLYMSQENNNFLRHNLICFCWHFFFIFHSFGLFDKKWHYLAIQLALAISRAPWLARTGKATGHVVRVIH